LRHRHRSWSGAADQGRLARHGRAVPQLPALRLSGRFRSFAGTIPTGLKITRNAFATLWAAPIGANRRRRLCGSLKKSQGLIITRIIYDAQSRVKNRCLNKPKRPGPKRCRRVFVLDETVYARLFQDRLLEPNHYGIMMNKDGFHNFVTAQVHSWRNGAHHGRRPETRRVKSRRNLASSACAMLDEVIAVHESFFCRNPSSQ